MLQTRPLIDTFHQWTWQDFLQHLQKRKSKNQSNLTPEELRAYHYYRSAYDFEYFVNTFFSERCTLPFSKMHRTFFQQEKTPNKRGCKMVIAAPRGHAKTTFKVTLKAIHAIVYGYERFIVILAATEQEATERVFEILNILRNNKKLRSVYGDLAPRQGKNPHPAKWGKEDFVTRNNVRVLGKSRMQQVRGIKHEHYRPTLIICDDVEKLENTYNEEQRDKIYQWFTKDVIYSEEIGKTTNIIVIGTCLHSDALISRLLKRPGWETHLFKAVESFPINKALEEQFREIYCNLTNPNRVPEARAFYMKNIIQILEGCQLLWPDGDSYLNLLESRINEGEASFRSEKQNEPFDPEKQLFNMELASYITVVFESGEFTGIQFDDRSKKQIGRHQIQRIVAFHDPSSVESKNSDYAAIVVVALDIYGYVYCLDAWVEKASPTKQLQAAWRLYEKWGFDRLYVESNLFQRLLKDEYDRFLKTKNQKIFKVFSAYSHTNKYQRISMLEPSFSNGYLKFNKRLPLPFNDQMHLFPTSYDDGPDALHGAWEQLMKTPGRILVSDPGGVFT